jgi:hypothetical protein
MSRVPSRELESRIRDLCAKVITAPEPELGPLLSELQSALHEHSDRLRKMVAESLARIPKMPGWLAHLQLKETSTPE